MKKVLISGVAGFLGQNLSRAFIEKGWQVITGFDDLSVGRKDWLHPDVRFIKMDVAGPLMLNYVKKDSYDLVIHLASRKIPRLGDSAKVLIENTAGITNMAHFAQYINARFIYLSTSDIYGKNNEWSETSDLILGQTDIRRWSYALTKIWGEQLLFSTPESFDFRIVRLFGTYGPYHALSWTAGPQSVFISQALKKEPLSIHGNGYQMRTFQYVDDAVDGIIRIATSDRHRRQVFNIGNPNEPVSINRLAKMIWDIVNPNDEMKIEYIPPSPFKYEEIKNRIPDISKATNLLNFNPKVDLEEGLRRTIEWQKTVI